MPEDFDKKLLNLIKERRSIRKFKKIKISREIILSLIEAAIWAPTACNNQELRFFILKDENEIKNILNFKPNFQNVSNVILIFADMSLPQSKILYTSKNGKYLPYIDAGLAMANIVLYAKSIGIDSCIINLSKFHRSKYTHWSLIKKVLDKIKAILGLHSLIENSFEYYLRKHLKIPNKFEILGGVILGYGNEEINLTNAMHFGKKIMREPVQNYIIGEK